MTVLAWMFSIHFFYPGIFDRAELFAYDLRINRIGARPATGLVAIGAIDDKSIAELGHWPWPRSVMARLEYAFSDYKVKVVGFDVMFSESDGIDAVRAQFTERLRATSLKDSTIRNVVGPGNDEAFAAALKAQGASVLGYAFQSHGTRKSQQTDANTGYLTAIRPPGPLEYGVVRQIGPALPILITARAYAPPIPQLNQAARATGFVNIDHDDDGEIRSEMTVIRFNDRYCAPLFMAVANVFAGSPPLSLKIDREGIAGVALAGVDIPVDQTGRMLVNYRHGAEPFRHYSVSDIVNHRLPADALAGKILLVGMTAQGEGDRAVTPFGGDVPRVEIHAHAIDNILQGDFIQRPAEAQEISFIGTFVVGLAIAIAVAWISALSSAAVTVMLIFGYFVYVQHRLIHDGLAIGVIFPLVTALIVYMVLAGYRYVTEGLEKRHLRTAFEHYLHPQVVAAIAANPKALKLSGERRHMSILFADIVNYTGLAERTDPAALVALLNDYMTKMTDHILESGGVVDKIRGDGIMAFWGAPLDVPNHARAAINCGLAMLVELRALHVKDPRFADIDIGVGVATGDAIVGTFGGEHRFDYSVIGDTVNLASRLEGLTRQFKVHLLVSQQSFAEAGNGLIARELGQVKVKGKELYVPIVEV
ncbi:MAG: adenylate cyclase, partial [Candidatus Binatus sp.]|nr:adenylate cyclase [Candidatus Binatus sp.]